MFTDCRSAERQATCLPRSGVRSLLTGAAAVVRPSEGGRLCFGGEFGQRSAEHDAFATFDGGAGAARSALPCPLQILKTPASSNAEADDCKVWEKVEVPCVGGPADGRSLRVPLDDDGLPPTQIDQSWLWVEYGSELFDLDTNGQYELEPVAGHGPPWVYAWVSQPLG
jgi:hypothetical protein